MGERFETAAITVEFDGPHAIVELGGSAGAGTARLLGAVLSALVDHGTVDLVVSLAGLEPVDDSFRAAIVDISSRLGGVGGRLTVRASSETARHLNLSGIDADVEFELDAAHVTTLGTEQQTDDESFRVVGHPVRSAHVVTRIGSKLTDEAIDTAFHRVTVLAAEIVGGAHGASVTLARAGRLTTAASSNDTVLRMDRHQYDTGEGPCLAAATDGHWFHIPALQLEDRWPAFIPLAMRDGIASILSTPIMIAGRPIGALNIYSSHEGAFGSRQQQLAAALSTHAAGVLVDIGADDLADERTRAAMRSRAMIALAQGILVERSHLTPSRAMAVLLRSARDLDMLLVDYAAHLIDASSTDTQQEPSDPAS